MVNLNCWLTEPPDFVAGISALLQEFPFCCESLLQIEEVCCGYPDFCCENTHFVADPVFVVRTSSFITGISDLLPRPDFLAETPAFLPEANQK